MQNVILPLIDRLIAPVVQRLDQMDTRQREDAQHLHAKLDAVAAVGHRVQNFEGTAQDLKHRLEEVENNQIAQAASLARTQGRNDVIVWVLGVIGGPVVVALTLAGIAKVFNISLGV
jgi:hypothetical protein